MYSPVTIEDDKFERMERNLLKAPKKQAVYYEEEQSAVSGFFEEAAGSKDNYYCDTTDYENYLNEIKNIQVSTGPFGGRRVSNDCSGFYNASPFDMDMNCFQDSGKSGATGCSSNDS